MDNRLNRARRIAQEWRTLQREGVLHTVDGSVTFQQWRQAIRDLVRRRTGDTGRYGVAEAAVALYTVERDRVPPGIAARCHVGAHQTPSGPNAGKVYARVAKWRETARKRNG